MRQEIWKKIELSEMVIVKETREKKQKVEKFPNIRMTFEQFIEKYKWTIQLSKYTQEFEYIFLEEKKIKIFPRSVVKIESGVDIIEMIVKQYNSFWGQKMIRVVKSCYEMSLQEFLILIAVVVDSSQYSVFVEITKK